MRQDLSSYIKGMLSKGYSKEQISSALLKFGCSVYEIEEQFRQLNPRHLHFSIWMILLIVGAFAIVGTLIYLLYHETSYNIPFQQTTIDIKNAEMLNQRLSFTLDILSTERVGNPVIIKYLLEDNMKNIIDGSDEIYFETRIYKIISLKLPETIKDGEYKLRVSATINGKVISSETKILFHNNEMIVNYSDNMKNKSIAILPPNSACDDSNPCTRDYSEDGGCVHEQLIPCCGNSVCEADENPQTCDTDCINIEKPLTREELYSIARGLISTNPEKAMTYCRQLIFITDRDFCYNDIAQGSKDSRYCLVIDSNIKKDECFSLLANSTQEPALCGSVKSDSTRDKCYIQFIVAGDYSLCQSLTDDRLKETCSLLDR